jgi:nicotinamide-nucleotide amidase
MKVEIISIGTELLHNDVIDVNAVRATTCLREIGTSLTCRVTVGDDADMIVQAVQSALQRADVILTMGGLGYDANDFTRQAILRLLHASPRETHLPGAKFLGMNEHGSPGYQLNLDGKTLICLPGGRRRVAHLLETEVVPFLKMRQKQGIIYTGDILLHTAGLVDSDIRQRLEPLLLTEAEQVMLHSFAGQTDIRLWVEANSPDKVKERLNILRTDLYNRLSDHIYGEGETRLEQVVMDTLRQRRLSLAIAECYTQRALYRLLAPFVSTGQAVSFLPVKSPDDINAMLDISDLN